MQFKIKKELNGGRFYVRLELATVTETDKAKAEKFGWPSITVSMKDGREATVQISYLGQLTPYGFYSQQDADVYFENLKTQIAEIQNRWNSLDDNWSYEEIL
jgi:hypothetical protein